MVVFWFIFLWFITIRPAFAEVFICKFSHNVGSDWVEVCNKDNQIIDLGGYSLKDSSGDVIAKNIGCSLPTYGRVSIGTSNRLNKDNDYIVLVNLDKQVDCVSYGNNVCPNTGIHIDVATDKCHELSETGWVDTEDCSNTSVSECLVPSIPPTPTPTPTPTPIPTPTNTPSSKLTISILHTPDKVCVEEAFEVKILTERAKISTEYYVKAFGGTTDNYSIETENKGEWHNFNGDWQKMPIILTNHDGVFESSIMARIKYDEKPGIYNLKVKIHEVNGNTEAESESKNIEIISKPSSTPTQKPTLTPTSTSTPSQQPTDTPAQEKNSADDLNLPTNIEGSTLGATTYNNTWIPVVLMGTGSILLIVPLIIGKLKR